MVHQFDDELFHFPGRLQEWSLRKAPTLRRAARSAGRGYAAGLERAWGAHRARRDITKRRANCEGATALARSQLIVNSDFQGRTERRRKLGRLRRLK